MIRFNYLQSARPYLLRRFLDLRISNDLRGPLFAMASAIVIVAIAWVIEAHRLSATTTFENAFKKQYLESRLQMTKTKALYSSVERFAALAREIQEIQASGDEEAFRFAEIGNRLPPHSWLTSISDDGAGMSLSGKAINLAILSRTMSRLSHSGHGYTSALLLAKGDDRKESQGILHYELRVEAVP